ncbi:hypothetical protein RvY_09201 [Ramazzottius varieornatus]|uniref:RRM domain-containing protein n=1 Tax=Ramazzottius varieornatus TaxID=947166 RepID=A0A1D1V8M3_RAMVA|nr:hypothetical protein RvY_09201 [Ramazzottius varieornatus]
MNFSRRERREHFEKKSQGGSRFPPAFGGNDDQRYPLRSFDRRDFRDERTAPHYQFHGGADGNRSGASGPPRQPSKMGRIILRNLPFSTKESDLHALMGKCGKITEVRIPLKEDGKMRGFAFVQFQSINSAETAVNMFNACKVKDRIIAVDWAVAKSRYEEAKAAKKDEPSKHEDLGKISLRDEDGEAEESVMDDDEDSKSRFTGKNGPEDTTPDATDDTSSDQDEDDDNDEEEEVDEEANVKEKKKPRAPKKINDVEQGRTLFVRNIPFDTTSDQLRDEFKKFGVLKYALVCTHPDSGHSRGNGFVQFRDKESADKCLSAATTGKGISIDQRALAVCVAETPKQRRKADKKNHEKRQQQETEEARKPYRKVIAKHPSRFPRKDDGKSFPPKGKDFSKPNRKPDTKRPLKSKPGKKNFGKKSSKVNGKKKRN